MHVSNDDTWDVKITLQCVTFDHGSKRLLVQKLGQKCKPKVGYKNCLNCVGLVKINLS
jgi:hypothetical protein